MKVRAYTNVDIDCEVDVVLNDLLNEFLEKCEELEGETRCGRLAATLCGATTQVLSKMPDSAIEHMKPEAKQEMVKRLSHELARYQMSLGLETVHKDQERLEAGTIVLSGVHYVGFDLRSAIDLGRESLADNESDET